MFRILLCVFSGVLFLKSQESFAQTNNDICAAKGSRQLSIVTYNVQNFFNATHEDGKNDYEFLPTTDPLKEQGCKDNNRPQMVDRCLKTNWTNALYQKKIQTFQSIIARINPDIVSLVEIENEKVTDDLRKAIGMDYYFINRDTDFRGIRVAILIRKNSSINIIKGTSYPVSHFDTATNKERNERDILELSLEINSQPVSLLLSHWAATMTPVSARIATAQKLVQLAQNATQKGQSVIAMGDYNTDGSETPNPLQILSNAGLNDLDQAYSLNFKRNLSTMPIASYFVTKDMRWTNLDHVYFKMLNPTKLNMNIASYQIVRYSDISRNWEYREGPMAGKTEYNIPASFNMYDGSGFSDHFPVNFKICY